MLSGAQITRTSLIVFIVGSGGGSSRPNNNGHSGSISRSIDRRGDQLAVRRSDAPGVRTRLLFYTPQTATIAAAAAVAIAVSGVVVYQWSIRSLLLSLTVAASLRKPVYGSSILSDVQQNGIHVHVISARNSKKA